jgi:hypothetical protein
MKLSLRSTTQTALFIGLTIAAFAGYTFLVSAAAPNGGYTPGATLDPDCAPGDTDCIVQSSGGGASLATYAEDSTDVITPIASGDGSVAIGSDATASGTGSIAIGFDLAFGPGFDGPTATGTGSIAMGTQTLSSGIGSLAAGFATTATGNGSVAFGTLSSALEDSAFSAGDQTTASGYGSVALGNGTTASGYGSLAAGSQSIASGFVSFALGTEIEARSAHEIVMGRGVSPYTPASDSSWDVNDRLFTIGNADIGSSDAFTILKSGQVGIGIDNFEASADASALLTLGSTTQGFLMPRMTEAERDAISSPATGLQVYNTDDDEFNYYNGSAWVVLGGGGGSSQWTDIAGGSSLEFSGSGLDDVTIVDDDGFTGGLDMGVVGLAGDTRVDFSTGSFNSGDTVTGLTSGATATVRARVDISPYVNAYYLYNVTGTFIDGETLENQDTNTSVISSSPVVTTTDSFVWILDGDVTDADTMEMTGSDQVLFDNFTVSWASTTGHTANDQWSLMIDLPGIYYADGQVGIGTATPAYGFDHEGSFQSLFYDGSSISGMLFNNDDSTGFIRGDMGNDEWAGLTMNGAGTLEYHQRAGNGIKMILGDAAQSSWNSGEEFKFYFDSTNPAIRMGSVDNNNWDNNNGPTVGDRSIAIGFADTANVFGAPIASGAFSIALGTGSEASGPYSFAWGSPSVDYETTGPVASGFLSMALGGQSLASGDFSFASGIAPTASGVGSTAFSEGTASGNQSFAAGSATASAGKSFAANSATASATNATAFGQTTASGSYSFSAGGQGLQAYSGYEFGFGQYSTVYTPASAFSWDSADRLFNIGNGSGSGLTPTSDAFTILKSGLTGIGYDNFETSTETAILQVNGSILQTGASGCSLTADADGEIICTPSDQNLKENIITLSSGLDLVNALRPVTYDFKNSTYGSGEQLGFIAQELQGVIPQVVTNGPDYKSVNYGLITPVLAKAIQELDIKISDIQSLANEDNSFGDILRNWFASATNGIQEFVAGTVRAKNQLCIDDVCVTKSQLQNMIQVQSLNDGNTGNEEDLGGNVSEDVPPTDPEIAPLSDEQESEQDEIETPPEPSPEISEPEDTPMEESPAEPEASTESAPAV